MSVLLSQGHARLQLSHSGQILALSHAPTLRHAVQVPHSAGYSSLLVCCRAREDAHGGVTYAQPAWAMHAVADGATCRIEGRTNDGAVEVLCQIVPEIEHGWMWHTRVINHGPLPVHSVTVPLIERAGWNRGERGAVVVPFNSGWVVPVEHLLNQDELVLHYPVHCSMQWIDLFTEDAGLYLAVHDPVPWLKQLVIRRQATGVVLAWCFADLHLLPGQSVWLPPVALAVHDGDWREGAAIYRRWINPYLTFPQPPEWIAERPAWCWLPMKDQHAPRPKRVFAELPVLMDRIGQAGVSVGHIAGWMEHGHDTHFPDYWPGECMGGAEGLRAAVAEIHRRGQRLAVYTNGRLMDPEGSVGRMERWQEMAVVSAPCARENAFLRMGNAPVATAWDPDERLAKETYTNVTFALGCPGCPRWRALLVERLAQAVLSCSADGLYVDQVCGCSGIACYAEGHDHAHPPLAWSGYQPLLRELRSRVREKCPDAYLATEGMGDLLGQHFDVQQAHNDWAPRMLIERGLPLPELFRWTFPELLVAIGPTSPNQEEYLRLGHAMAAGFDNFALLAERCEPVFLDFARRTFSWRAALSSWIVRGSAVRVTTTDWPDCRVFGLRTENTVLVTGAWLADLRNPAAPRASQVAIDWPFDRTPVAAQTDDGRGWRDADATIAPSGRVICRTPAAACFAVRLRADAP